ncbi:hypothetical protein V2W45_1338528 [Cenococcum geophilum]
MEDADLKFSQLPTPGNIGAHENQIWHINKPFRFSWFPYEIALIPKAWAVTTEDLPPASEGGHFAAVEQPEVLWDNVVAFVGRSGRLLKEAN